MSPLRTLTHLADAGSTRELGMLGQMPRLPVHGDGDARANPAVHLLELLAPRMAGDVDQRVAVGENLAAQIDELVLDAANLALVSRNGARGEDDEVAPPELDAGVLVLGDARQRRARLALAACAQEHHLVAVTGRRNAPGPGT